MFVVEFNKLSFRCIFEASCQISQLTADDLADLLVPVSWHHTECMQACSSGKQRSKQHASTLALSFADQSGKRSTPLCACCERPVKAPALSQFANVLADDAIAVCLWPPLATAGKSSERIKQSRPKQKRIWNHKGRPLFASLNSSRR